MAGKKEQQLKEITERLEQGVKELFTSEMYTEYLKTMSQFHNYSFNNTLLIAMQRPDATLVAGYQAWKKKFNRQVKRGEKGIQIISPAPIREKEEVEKFDPETNEPILRPDGQPEMEEVVHTIPRFRVATVFDVSQTYGDSLPELATPELMGSVENYAIFMEAIREVSPVFIRFDEIESGAKGYYSNADKEIVIQNGLSERQTMKTAVHEVTHAKLHDREIMEELGEKKNQMTKEVEAESVAYTVCQYFGLDTSDYSFPYIAGWSSDMDMRELRESMDTIRKTAGEFIDSLVEKFHEIQRQQLVERGIQMDDVVLRISGSMGSEFEYSVVRNMTVGQLDAAVRDYARVVEEDAFLDNVPLEDYLAERGAELTFLSASDGLGEDSPVDFFDVEYDVDTGISMASELSVQRQTEMLFAKAEYREPLFGEEDKRLVTEYAVMFGNMEDTKTLIRELMEAMESPDLRSVEEIHRFVREKIDSLQDVEKTPEQKTIMETQYQQVELFDVPALFSNGRVNMGLLPEGMYRYELCGADYDPGYPLTVENSVTVNHAATILTAIPLELPEQGRLRLGDELNFTGGMQSMREYLKEMAGHDLQTEQEKAENAIGRANEPLYLSGQENRYAIYQISDGTKGREYKFMNLDFVHAHNMAVDGADYHYVYGGRLSDVDTLASLLIKFNINHPEGYTGHSLSVSDVVVLQKDGQTKAYYANGTGFQEIPEFVQQRLREAEMNRKREDSMITLDTSGVEIEQHEGLWHTVEKREIQDEIFYLMKHNEYGDSVAGVIVNADGRLVAQELEHGFDHGAMEAIREYFAGKGIEWKPEEEEQIQENKGEKIYPSVYQNNLAYAMEHAEADTYLDSRKLNIDCKNAVEGAIREKFDGLHLADDVVEPVLEEYGSDRLSYVLACTLQHKSWDGRFSRENKAWAETIPVSENINRGVDATLDYVVESHPAVLDGFLNLYRQAIAELTKEHQKEEISSSMIPSGRDQIAYDTGDHYFLIQTTDGGYDYTFYDKNYRESDGGVYDNPDISIEEAAAEIMEDEGISPENCKEVDYDEIMEEVEEIEKEDFERISLEMNCPDSIFEEYEAREHPQDLDFLALKMENLYMTVQFSRGTYEAIFYDSEFKEINGSEYGNEETSIKEAARNMILAEGMNKVKCEKIDSEKFKQDIQRASLKRLESEKIPTSQLSLYLPSLGGWSRHEVENGVMELAFEKLQDMGKEKDVELLGAWVYGSRSRDGLFREDSDIDVVLSYQGDLNEDDFFNALHENMKDIEGIPVDINPISADKTGTLYEYVRTAEEYLDEKELEQLALDLDQFSYDYDPYEYRDSVDNREENVKIIKDSVLEQKTADIKTWLQEVVEFPGDEGDTDMANSLLQRLEKIEEKVSEKQPQQKEPTLSYYVAECMEFSILGEYHGDLTLKEAIEIYNSIPADRMNGIKGIGIDLQDGSIYSGEYPLMSLGRIDMDMIDQIDHFRESPLVQQAIKDMQEAMPIELMRSPEAAVEKTSNQNVGESERKESPGKENLEKETDSEKPQEHPKEKGKGKDTVSGGRKESVLKALRERQNKLKEQEKSKDKAQSKKKGEQEL